MTWTEENTATLISLRAQEKSAGYIASELGMTRNQVVGKLVRMGLMGTVHVRARRKRKYHQTADVKRLPNDWNVRLFLPYPLWKAERQKERELGLR